MHLYNLNNNLYHIYNIPGENGNIVDRVAFIFTSCGVCVKARKHMRCLSVSSASSSRS